MTILWWALHAPLLSASIASQTASVPLVRHLAGATDDVARSSKRSQRQRCFLVACFVSTWLGPKDPGLGSSWVSQQLIPLLPRCCADSGDLLNPVLFAYWAALYGFCFANTKYFSSPKSYLESFWKNYRDPRYLFFSIEKWSIISDPIRFLLLVISTKLFDSLFLSAIFWYCDTFLATYLLMSKDVLIS